jgi:hypothetical protein
LTQSKRGAETQRNSAYTSVYCFWLQLTIPVTFVNYFVSFVFKNNANKKAETKVPQINQIYTPFISA